MELEFEWRGDSLLVGGEEVGAVWAGAFSGWCWATREAWLPCGCFVAGGELSPYPLRDRSLARAGLEEHLRAEVERDHVNRGGW